MDNNVRKYVLLFAVLALLLFAINPVIRTLKTDSDKDRKGMNDLLPIENLRSSELGIKLFRCGDELLRLGYLCDFSWPVQRRHNGLLITIEDQPQVLFKILKVDVGIQYIEQLSRDRIEAIGQYQSGFVTEEGRVAGIETIKVKAYAKGDPETRLLDYYFVKNDHLYGLFFSVKPKELWEKYQFVFQDILSGFWCE